MEKVYNPKRGRWEVYKENPAFRAGQPMPVYVNADEDSVDAYITAIDKARQKAEILNYIREHGSIWRGDAMRMHIAELSARICEMRNEGIDIKSKVVKEYYPDGKYKGYHKEYWI